MRSEYGQVLFSTVRLKAMDLVLQDADDLRLHWKTFPPTQDYPQWPQESFQAQLEDMIADQAIVPRYSFCLLVRDRQDLSLVGYVNAWKLAEHHFLPTLGITIEPAYQRQGYGTEIYRGLIGFAFDKYTYADHLQAEINPENLPSLKMHFNCGMQPFCFKKDGYKDGDLIEDEMSMRISRAHFEKKWRPPRHTFSIEKSSQNKLPCIYGNRFGATFVCGPNQTSQGDFVMAQVQNTQNSGMGMLLGILLAVVIAIGAYFYFNGHPADTMKVEPAAGVADSSTTMERTTTTTTTAPGAEDSSQSTTTEQSTTTQQ